MPGRREIGMTLLIIGILSIVLFFIYYDSLFNIELVYMDPMIIFRNIFFVFFLFWIFVIALLLLVIKK